VSKTSVTSVTTDHLQNPLKLKLDVLVWKWSNCGVMGRSFGF